jgi:hypothetical protein
VPAGGPLGVRALPIADLVSSDSPYPPSPVPSDDDLGDDELPFTAFGQFGPGKLDLRVFDQDVYWVDVYGQGHLLTQMSADYRRNVIEFCLQHAASYHAAYVVRELVGSVVEAFEGRPSAAVLSSQLGVPTAADLDADTWIKTTPLLRRLRALTPETEG